MIAIKQAIAATLIYTAVLSPGAYKLNALDIMIRNAVSIISKRIIFIGGLNLKCLLCYRNKGLKLYSDGKAGLLECCNTEISNFSTFLLSNFFKFQVSPFCRAVRMIFFLFPKSSLRPCRIRVIDYNYFLPDWHKFPEKYCSA